MKTTTSAGNIKSVVHEIAKQCANKGPGWAQEGVALRLVRDFFAENLKGERELDFQWSILEAWHDLFTEKKLVWGYDLDNPSPPFYHIRRPITNGQENG